MIKNYKETAEFIGFVAAGLSGIAVLVIAYFS